MEAMCGGAQQSFVDIYVMQCLRPRLVKSNGVGEYHRAPLKLPKRGTQAAEGYIEVLWL